MSNRYDSNAYYIDRTQQKLPVLAQGVFYKITYFKEIQTVSASIFTGHADSTAFAGSA